MELSFESGILALIGIIAIWWYLDKQKEKKPPTVTETPPTTIVQNATHTPGRTLPPLINSIYIDDAVTPTGGDYNHYVDLAFVLSAMAQNNQRFSVGASCVGNNQGVSTAVPKQLVNASKLQVPVLIGNENYRPGRSELSEHIVAQTKKGSFNICIGGPMNDVADAIRNGAHAHNLIVWPIGRGTWNEFTDKRTENETRNAMDLVYSRAGAIHDIPNYRIFLKCPRGVEWANKWMRSMRTQHPMLEIAFSENVMQKNIAMNAAQNVGAHGLRIADFLTVETFFGLAPSNTGFDPVIARFENGIKILKEFK